MRLKWVWVKTFFTHELQQTRMFVWFKLHQKLQMFLITWTTIWPASEKMQNGPQTGGNSEVSSFFKPLFPYQCHQFAHFVNIMAVMAAVWSARPLHVRCPLCYLGRKNPHQSHLTSIQKQLQLSPLCFYVRTQSWDPRDLTTPLPDVATGFVRENLIYLSTDR